MGHPLLFHNFKQYNIRAATAHCPMMQNEMGELSAKGSTESSTGVAGF